MHDDDPLAMDGAEVCVLEEAVVDDGPQLRHQIDPASIVCAMRQTDVDGLPRAVWADRNPKARRALREEPLGINHLAEHEKAFSKMSF